MGGHASTSSRGGTLASTALDRRHDSKRATDRRRAAETALLDAMLLPADLPRDGVGVEGQALLMRALRRLLRQEGVAAAVAWVDDPGHRPQVVAALPAEMATRIQPSREFFDALVRTGTLQVLADAPHDLDLKALAAQGVAAAAPIAGLGTQPAAVILIYPERVGPTAPAPDPRRPGRGGGSALAVDGDAARPRPARPDGRCRRPPRPARGARRPRHGDRPRDPQSAGRREDLSSAAARAPERSRVPRRLPDAGRRGGAAPRTHARRSAAACAPAQHALDRRRRAYRRGRGDDAPARLLPLPRARNRARDPDPTRAARPRPRARTRFASCFSICS